jgi:hypothetical protein
VTTTTDVYGSYTFTTTEVGVHTVVEEDPMGYYSTTPNEVHVDVTTLGEGYEVNFGDALTSTEEFGNIYGVVFEDADGDGIFDDDEVGIAGVELTLDGVVTATTDVYGSYTLTTTVVGVHTVVETDLPGYFSTTPNEIHVDVTTLGEGYEVNFGDALTSTDFASVYGVVFEDVNSNGEWDSEETGIVGVTVTLDSSQTTSTGPYGEYTLSTATPGPHVVVETDLPGYFSTTPNEVFVIMALGNGYEVNFGDVLAEICICDGDSYEDDDSPSQATLLEVGYIYSQTHDFCDDATDWYTFTARAHDVYTITTSSWDWRADTSLAIFDADGHMLAANDDHEGTTDFSSRIVWKAPSDGIYYVRATNRSGMPGCHTNYDIWLEYRDLPDYYLPLMLSRYSGRGNLNMLPLVLYRYSSSASLYNLLPHGSPTVDTVGTEEGTDDLLAPTGIISHTCQDAYEVDDTWQDAREIEPGVVQVHSFDSDPWLYAPDKDHVWLQLDTFQTITFTIPSFTNTQTLLELYDDEGASLNVTGTTGLEWQAPSDGRYYLSVSPLSHTFGCVDTAGYELVVEVSEITQFYFPIIYRN